MTTLLRCPNRTISSFERKSNHYKTVQIIESDGDCQGNKERERGRKIASGRERKKGIERDREGERKKRSPFIVLHPFSFHSPSNIIEK